METPSPSGRHAGTSELPLAAGEYVYTQDSTSGQITVHAGPIKVNVDQQQFAVVYDPRTERFVRSGLEEAVQKNITIPHGSYCVLHNPASGDAKDKHPSFRSKNDWRGDDFQYGRTVVIQKAGSFALWPRQTAKVIPGHQLRSNEYVVIRIADEEAARLNWSDAVVKTVTETTPLTEDGEQTAEQKTKPKAPASETTPKVTSEVPKDLATGKLYIIRGTEVSYYIPPTGVEVLADENNKLVREALTLERLHYCILQNEDGNKRVVVGPDVVFPEPDESFVYQDEKRAYRAEDLSPIRGLYIKVSATYEEPLTVRDPETRQSHDIIVRYVEGSELFVTGAEIKEYLIPVMEGEGQAKKDNRPIYRMAVMKGQNPDEDLPDAKPFLLPGTLIYYPRPEHSVVKYNETSKKVYAVMVPKGKAYYVANRLTGCNRIVRGETMLLPDPRYEIIVKRFLTAKQCDLWYPGNEAALEYNRSLAEAVGANTSQYGLGVEYGAVAAAAAGEALALDDDLESLGARTRGLMPQVRRHVSKRRIVEDAVDFEDAEAGTGEFDRRTNFTPPRSITLNERFEGVPVIRVRSGYAVMVVGAEGNRRVVQGPEPVFMGYDEELEILRLSRGRPKGSVRDKRETVYLQTTGNKVRDIIEAETADHVQVKLLLSFNVEFEGDDPSKWFACEDYVRVLCEHARSILKGHIRKLTVEEFYTNSVDILRNSILGTRGEDDTGRPGMVFSDNGMRVTDVEVLDVTIGDREIEKLLAEAQHAAVRTNIEIANSRRDLKATIEREEIEREKLRAKDETAAAQAELKIAETKRNLDTSLAELARDEETAKKRLEVQTAKDAVDDATNKARIDRDNALAEAETARKQAIQALDILLLKEQTKATTDRFKAAQEGFAEALTVLGDKQLAMTIAEAQSVTNFIGGKSVPEAIQELFANTPFADRISKVLALAESAHNGTHAQA